MVNRTDDTHVIHTREYHVFCSPYVLQFPISFSFGVSSFLTLGFDLSPSPVAVEPSLTIGASVGLSFTSTVPFQPAVTIGFDLSPSPVAVEPSLMSGTSVVPSFTSTTPFQPAVTIGFDLSPSSVAVEPSLRF